TGPTGPTGPSAPSGGGFLTTDFSNACTSGAPLSPTGCFGDVSTTNAKNLLKSLGLAQWANIPYTSSVPDSLYIISFNSPPPSTGVINIRNLPTNVAAVCTTAWLSTSRPPYYTSLMFNNRVSSATNLTYTPQSQFTATNNTTWRTIAAVGSNAAAIEPLIDTLYVVCIGKNITNNTPNSPAALSGGGFNITWR
ncbi:MAG: hypothetical protein Q8L68_06220, partial [Methylococcales bacterium]|nr:hypothetical protein [Methylococcales bacterium]